MTDYSPIPSQPIVQGVVTLPIIGGVPVPTFTGEGVELITRLAGFPVGVFVLFLDPGLPGNAGAVPPGTSTLVNPEMHTMITMRGSGGPPVASAITTIAVAYPLSLLPGVGCDRIVVVLGTQPPAPADPPAGFEIIVWRTTGNG